MGYAVELRERVIETALRGSQRQWEIAEKYGIGLSTLQKWLKEYRAGGSQLMSRKKEKRPQDWRTAERLEALLETAGMSEEALGSWCRRKGLHTHHLEKWKQEAVSGSMGKQDTAVQAELKRLREENKQLQKALRRKDKALAEASALLILKKSRCDLGGRRGRLIMAAQRQRALDLLEEAGACGCRVEPACEVLGVPLRTVQRWRTQGLKDQRKGSRSRPANQLSDSEREQVLKIVTSVEFSDMSPNQIVPALVDRGK